MSSYETSSPSIEQVRLYLIRPPSSRCTCRNCTSWFSVAEYSRTGTLTSPKETAPFQIARIAVHAPSQCPRPSGGSADSQRRPGRAARDPLDGDLLRGPGPALGADVVETAPVRARVPDTEPMTDRATAGPAGGPSIPAAPTGLEVRVLGGLELVVDGRPVALRGRVRRRLVLTLLAGPGAVSAEDLVEGLWPDRAVDDTSVNAVHAHVSRLRRLLDPSGSGRGAVWLASEGSRYRLVPTRLDAEDLERRISGAEALVATDPAAARALLADALAATLPPVTEDLPAWEVLAGHWRMRWRHAEETWADLVVRSPESAARADDLLALARAEPTREVRWALAMRALALAGRQAEALAAYREAREVLLEEVGVEPGSDLRLTHEAVLRQAQLTRVGWEAAPGAGPRAADELHRARGRAGPARRPRRPAPGRHRPRPRRDGQEPARRRVGHPVGSRRLDALGRPARRGPRPRRPPGRPPAGAGPGRRQPAHEPGGRRRVDGAAARPRRPRRRRPGGRVGLGRRRHPDDGPAPAHRPHDVAPTARGHRRAARPPRPAGAGGRRAARRPAAGRSRRDRRRGRAAQRRGAAGRRGARPGAADAARRCGRRRPPRGRPRRGARPVGGRRRGVRGARSPPRRGDPRPRPQPAAGARRPRPAPGAARARRLLARRDRAAPGPRRPPGAAPPRPPAGARRRGDRPGTGAPRRPTGPSPAGCSPTCPPSTARRPTGAGSGSSATSRPTSTPCSAGSPPTTPTRLLIGGRAAGLVVGLVRAVGHRAALGAHRPRGRRGGRRAGRAAG